MAPCSRTNRMCTYSSGSSSWPDITAERLAGAPEARRVEETDTMTVDRDDWPPAALTLVGRHVRLEPLDESHAAELLEAAADGQLWDLWYTSVPGPEGVDDWIADALDQRDAGRALPFVVRRARDERIVGSTRYMNIE